METEISENTTDISTSSDQNNDFFDTSHLKKDLKGRSVRGGMITVTAQGLKFVLRLGSTAVLARLLTPADYGLIAMVAVVMNFAMMFKDMGLSMATVQKAEINHGQVSNLFWFNVIVSFCLFIVVVALSPVVAWFYGEPRLAGITMALACSFIFGGLAVQHRALLQRQMAFGKLVATELAAELVAIVAAIFSACMGAGYWSLVYMQLVRALTAAIGDWLICDWRPGVPRRGAGVKPLLAFGGHLTGFNIINYFARNLDNILIGRFIGTSALGVYDKAYQLLLLPLRQINRPMQNVALPALSRLKNDPEQFKNYYRKTLMLVTMVSMPMIVFLFVDADKLILLVLGKQWIDIIPVFRALGVAAFIGTTYSIGSGVVFIALGNVKRQLKLSIVQTVVLACFFVFGLKWGVIGMAVAISSWSVIMRLPQVLVCFHSTFMSIKDFFLPISYPVLTSILSGLILYFFNKYSFISTLLLIQILIELIFYSCIYSLLWLVLPNGRSELSFAMRLFRK